jgi:Meiotically up-regulated gene 113
MRRDDILREIRRTAQANDGRPLGRLTFERETGIRYHDWFGKYWTNWGNAVREAGFEPNVLNSRIADDDLLRRFVELTHELGKVPVKGDLRMKRQADPSFPNDKVFERFGSKSELELRCRDYCLQRDELRPLAEMFVTGVSTSTSRTPATVAVTGVVYLLRMGRRYKIGRTNALGRREYELGIQLPEKSRTIHRIETDDPEGIEAYWHRRFAAKRGRGEWFALDASDVAAFKRRKYQ